MQIASDSSLVKKLSKLLSPILNFLFPSLITNNKIKKKYL